MFLSSSEIYSICSAFTRIIFFFFSAKIISPLKQFCWKGGQKAEILAFCLFWNHNHADYKACWHFIGSWNDCTIHYIVFKSIFLNTELWITGCLYYLPQVRSKHSYHHCKHFEEIDHHRTHFCVRVSVREEGWYNWAVKHSTFQFKGIVGKWCRLFSLFHLLFIQKGNFFCLLLKQRARSLFACLPFLLIRILDIGHGCKFPFYF